MKRPVLITGLDIGSSKVAAVSAETEKDGIMRIIAQATGTSKAVSKGMIVDLDETIDSISDVLGKLRDKTARKPGNIYVNISGGDVRGEKSRGMIPLTLRGREVTKYDIKRCIDAASTIKLPIDREIVHRIVHNFSVDDQPWIKNPLGLFASRLSCEVYIITAGINHIQNIYKCVNSAGYDVADIIFTGVADGSALLTNEDRKDGILLADIGSGLTTLSIFFEGVLSEISIIPIGAGDVKNDFKEDSALNDLSSKIRSIADNFLKVGGRLSNVTITGGMAFADGIVEFLEEKLSYPVKMGVVKDIRGDISGLDSVRLSTAIGLVKYACEKHSEGVLTYRNIPHLISAKVVDLFNNYF